MFISRGMSLRHELYMEIAVYFSHSQENVSFYFMLFGVVVLCRSGILMSIIYVYALADYNNYLG